MTAKNQKELDRRFRVLSQMISMHSCLRDRFRYRALLLNLCLLFCSVVFCALAFVSDDWFSWLGLKPDTAKFVLGIVSLLSFFAAMAELLVGWKQQSTDHETAANRLSVVMAEFRTRRHEDGSWAESKHATLKREYDQAMDEITPIPDSQFLALKTRHLRKVAISMAIDENPGRSLLITKLCFYYHSNFGRKPKSSKQHGNVEDSSA